jgi:hypothetical protein
MSRYRHAGNKGERRYSFYSFTTSALDGVSSRRHAPASLYPRGKDPGTHCTGGWVGPRAGLDTEARGNFASAVDRTPVVQSVFRHYTDWATGYGLIRTRLWRYLLTALWRSFWHLKRRLREVCAHWLLQLSTCKVRVASLFSSPGLQGVVMTTSKYCSLNFWAVLTTDWALIHFLHPAKLVDFYFIFYKTLLACEYRGKNII